MIFFSPLTFHCFRGYFMVRLPKKLWARFNDFANVFSTQFYWVVFFGEFVNRSSERKSTIRGELAELRIKGQDIKSAKENKRGQDLELRSSKKAGARRRCSSRGFKPLFRFVWPKKHHTYKYTRSCRFSRYTERAWSSSSATSHLPLSPSLFPLPINRLIMLPGIRSNFDVRNQRFFLSFHYCHRCSTQFWGKQIISQKNLHLKLMKHHHVVFFDGIKKMYKIPCKKLLSKETQYHLEMKHSFSDVRARLKGAIKRVNKTSSTWANGSTKNENIPLE